MVQGTKRWLCATLGRADSARLVAACAGRSVALRIRAWGVTWVPSTRAVVDPAAAPWEGAARFGDSRLRAYLEPTLRPKPGHAAYHTGTTICLIRDTQVESLYTAPTIYGAETLLTHL